MDCPVGEGAPQAQPSAWLHLYLVLGPTGGTSPKSGLPRQLLSMDILAKEHLLVCTGTYSTAGRPRTSDFSFPEH